MAVGSKMGVAGSEIGKKPEQITEGREQNRSVVTRWDRGICLSGCTLGIASSRQVDAQGKQ